MTLLKTKYHELKKWLKIDSAIKATWFVAIVTSMMLMVNTYVLYQNSKSLELSRKTLELSYDPSIEFQLYPDASYIINTSNQKLKDICIFPIAYVFDTSLQDVKIRNQPLSVGGKVKDYLEPQEKLKLSMLTLAPLTEDIYSLENINVYRSLVVTFRRVQDNKKFKVLHIYQISKVKDNIMIVSLGSGHMSGIWNGPPQRYMNIIEKIENIEKTMFNVENFK